MSAAGDDRKQSGLPRDLAKALDSWNVPGASAEFRGALRDQFMQAAATPLISPEAVVSELQAWDVPRVDGTFREQLREKFLNAAELQTSQPGRRGTLLTFPRMLYSLAAAALVFLLVTLNLPSGPSWESVEIAKGASYRINGEVVSQGHDDLVNDAFSCGGCRLVTGDDDLALLHLGEGLLLEFPADTELSFLPRSETEVGLIEIVVIRGGLRIATTEDFQGRVLVHTPQATIELEGKALGVDVVPQGTCLCIMGGFADVEVLGGEDAESFSVGDMSTIFVPGKGGVEHMAPGDLHHVDEMQAFSNLGKKYLY